MSSSLNFFVKNILSDCHKHSDKLSCCIWTYCHTAFRQIVVLHYDKLAITIPIYTTTYTHIYNNNNRGCRKKRALMFLVETFRLLLAIYFILVVCSKPLLKMYFIELLFYSFLLLHYLFHQEQSSSVHLLIRSYQNFY